MKSPCMHLNFITNMPLRLRPMVLSMVALLAVAQAPTSFTEGAMRNANSQEMAYF
jgi:hypothetical protein